METVHVLPEIDGQFVQEVKVRPKPGVAVSTTEVP